MYELNKYNIPSTKLYSKKQIFDTIDNYNTEKYYSCVTRKYYTAIISNGKLYAKQYPEKDLYYLVN